MERARAAAIWNAVREPWVYRDLVRQLVERDLIVRYRETIMGIGWALFQPVLYMVVFSSVMTRVGRADVGVPYPLFVFAGSLPWNLTAQAVRFGTTTLTSSAAILTKAYFPREVLVLSIVIVATIDFFVASVVLVGLLLWYHVVPGPTALFVPLILFVQILLTFGIALAASLANLIYRDVKYIIEALLTVWLFATPIAYPLDHVEGTFGWIVRANPLTPIVDAYRAVLLYGTPPALGPMAWSLGCAVGITALAWTAFHRLEPVFPELL